MLLGKMNKIVFLKLTGYVFYQNIEVEIGCRLFHVLIYVYNYTTNEFLQ